MFNLDASKKIDGVYYLSSYDNLIFDESNYILARKREGRLYPDSILKKLPSIENKHPLKAEWSVRERSLKKVSRYILNKKYETVLEVGCGNGWFSNAISKGCNCITAGLDVNKEELTQAARAFHKNENVKFIFGNIFEDIFPKALFDVIIFAASIQYFNSIDKAITSVSRFLKPGGEIHIIDSNFYDEIEIESARERSHKYYNELGVSHMAENYFHHSWNELNKINFRIMDRRNYWFSKIFLKFGIPGYQTFPWIVVTP